MLATQHQLGSHGGIKFFQIAKYTWVCKFSWETQNFLQGHNLWPRGANFAKPECIFNDLNFGKNPLPSISTWSFSSKI